LGLGTGTKKFRGEFQQDPGLILSKTNLELSKQTAMSPTEYD